MSWIDPDFPRQATPSDRVGRVLGLNPGMMTGPGTNTYLVGHRDPILIDTGAGVPEYMDVLASYLRERGWRQPSRVILTHRHVDHLGGVPHLRERFPGLSVSKLIFKDAGLPEGTTNLQDGQVIEGDGVRLRAIHTPGHASDHLCYFLEEERALFTGDLILSGSTSVIPDQDGDLGDYMDSLRRVQALGAERIYSAHGPVIDNAAAKIQEYIDHRLERERQILAALGNGARTIPDMVKAIYTEIPAKLHMAAGMSVHSHLKKLAKEGRVAEERISGAPSRWSLIS